MKDTTTSRHLDEGMDVDELTRLIHICGNAYGFTRTEHAEAVQAALNDPDPALACFRQIAAEVSTGNHATTRGEKK